MLRFRYLLLWAILGLLVVIFVSFGLENSMLELEALEVRTYTEIAADCALQTGQGIDDFFAEVDPEQAVEVAITNDRGIQSWYSASGVNGLRLMYTTTGSDSVYTTGDLLTWYIGQKHSVSNLTYNSLGHIGRVYSLRSYYDRHKAFDYLYNATGYASLLPNVSATALEFQKFATSRACIKCYTQIPYFYNGSLRWVKVPRIALIGARCIWTDESAYKASLGPENGLYGGDIDIGWAALTENHYLNPDRGGYFGKYFLTPSKVGVSYVSRDLVQALYQNNLDLLLRLKYHELATLDEHTGLVKDTWNIQSNYVRMAKSTYGSVNNVVNNGLIAINTDTSTITHIEYVTINLFKDTDLNNKLIEAVYGGVHDNSSTFSKTADLKLADAKLLKKLSPANFYVYTLGHWERQQPTYKNEIIAKVTFSTDVVLSHKTAVFTNWCTTVDGHDGDNLNDIVVPEGIGTNTSTRSKKYSYTRYYDVNA